MITRAKSGISKPKIYSLHTSNIDPTNFEEALSNHKLYLIMLGMMS